MGFARFRLRIHIHILTRKKTNVNDKKKNSAPTNKTLTRVFRLVNRKKESRCRGFRSRNCIHSGVENKAKTYIH